MQEDFNLDLTNEDAMHGKFLIFRVNNGNYGVEINYVTDIVAIQDITPVPNTQYYVKGIINLRGTIVPVIDMNLRFGAEELQYTDRTCIVVLSMNDIDIALIVDEVREVFEIDDTDLQPPPEFEEGSINSSFIKAISYAGNYVKQILNINILFEIDPAIT